MSVTKSIICPMPLDKIFIKLYNGDSIDGEVQVWDFTKGNQTYCAIKDRNGLILNINMSYIVYFTIERQRQHVVKVVKDPDMVADTKNKEEKERIEEFIKVVKEKNVLVKKVIKDHMNKPLIQIESKYSDGLELIERKPE